MPDSTPGTDGIQRKPPQSAEMARQNGDKSGDHIMPGIVRTLAGIFHMPRKHYTIRGAARAGRVSTDAMTTACIRDLKTVSDETRQEMARMSQQLANLADALGYSRKPETVREFVSTRKVA